MARYKHPSRKKKMAKAGRQTRWAPFWIIPKVFGKGKVMHPGRLTVIKRSWRRRKLKV